MTARRASPAPSSYSTGYKPGEAHWHPRMSKSPILSDSRPEYRMPRERGVSTLDDQHLLYAELRNMMREHRWQEDEARDSLIRQIRDHREQQDDLLVRIVMDLPRTFDENRAMENRSGTSRRDRSYLRSAPLETLEMDSALGSQSNQRSKCPPVPVVFQGTEDPQHIGDKKSQQPEDRERARSRTARKMTIGLDDEVQHKEPRPDDARRQDSPQAQGVLVRSSPSGKRKRSGKASAEAQSKKRSTMSPPSGVPPKRKAAIHAEKKNCETLAFFRQTQRQQSAALEQGRASAITTACTCNQTSCQFCGARAKLNQDSFEEKWK